MTLRTTDVKRAQAAVRHQFELVRKGVVLEEGSGMAFTFTKLNDIKPHMVAEATKEARTAAEQFAKDSGTSVRTIKSATQGYSLSRLATATRAAAGARQTRRSRRCAS